MCPVCAVAVCAGLGLSRWLKIDDTISGLWIGGLIISLSIVSAEWGRRIISFKKGLIIFGSLIIFFTIFPLYYWKVIGQPLNTFCGVDKLLYGIVMGAILFSAAIGFHLLLKKNHNNHSYFPFQKVVIPLAALIIASLVLYKIV